MHGPVAKIYNQLSHAENARNELLSSGFSADSVHLESIQSEAGPTAGNFAVGNGDPDGDNPGTVYERNFDDPLQPSNILLTVDAGDDGLASRASDIMLRHGGHDIP